MILTPKPCNLRLTNFLLLLSLHFRSLLCQTKTDAGGQLGAGSPWAGQKPHLFLLETSQTEVTKTTSDSGTEAQCYRFHIERSWQPTLYLLLEIRPPLSPTAMGISSRRFSLRPGSWQINRNKTLPPAAAPCVRLRPPPGQGNGDEPLRMGENKKSPILPFL